MSYVNVTPQYYEMLQPDGPFEAGSPGWSSAPVPGWGANPNLVGPPRWAVNGLGEPNIPKPLPPLAFIVVLGCAVLGLAMSIKEFKDLR